jgi:hypothetical protein
MNLLCPNCQKQLSVPEQNAGQLMKCPFCTKYFSVPALPQAVGSEAGSASPFHTPPTPPPPAPPSVQPDVFAVPLESAAPRTPPSSQEAPIGGRSSTIPRPPFEQAPPPPPPTGYGHLLTISISPRAVSWITLMSLFLVLVLMFFPWTGVYPGGYGVYKQSALQMIWGGYSVDQAGEQVVRLEKAITEAIQANWLMVFYFLLILAALVLAAAPIVQTQTAYPLPQPLQKLLPWRNILVVIATLLAFLILLRFLVGGSDFEKAVIAVIDKSMGKDPSALTQEEQIERGLRLSRLNLSRAFWLRGAVLFHIIALVGAACELWLQRRGERPPPRFEAHW